MDDTPPPNPTYAALDFLVRHGGWIAILAGLLPLLGGFTLWLSGQSIWFAAGGIVVAAFAYLIMRSYVELVRLVVDMLLPR